MHSVPEFSVGIVHAADPSADPSIRGRGLRARAEGSSAFLLHPPRQSDPTALSDRQSRPRLGKWVWGTLTSLPALHCVPAASPPQVDEVREPGVGMWTLRLAHYIICVDMRPCEPGGCIAFDCDQHVAPQVYLIVDGGGRRDVILRRSSHAMGERGPKRLHPVRRRCVIWVYSAGSSFCPDHPAMTSLLSMLVSLHNGQSPDIVSCLQPRAAMQRG